MKAEKAKTQSTIATAHETGFISAFVIPEKRSRYAEFLPKPKRRSEILNRLNHFFDFIAQRAIQIHRGSASDLAQILHARGAGRLGYIIGGDRDGFELPLEQAIDSSLASPSGAIISCIPGRLALYLQEFPPGDTFILHHEQST
jgi:hypothetical protein